MDERDQPIQQVDRHEQPDGSDRNKQSEKGAAAMSTRTTTDQSIEQAAEALQSAKVELYEAEIALHDARLTCVDEWIKAAAEHLHRACVSFSTADESYAEALRQAS